MRCSFIAKPTLRGPLKRQQLKHLAALCQLSIADIQAARSQHLDQSGMDLPSSLAVRIRLARALAARPGVLLVDDPAFLYDPLAQQALRSIAEDKLTLVIAAPDEQCLAGFHPDTVWRLEADDQGVQITAQDSHSVIHSPNISMNLMPK